MKPDHYEANIGLIRILVEERNYDEAIRLGRKLVASHGRARGLAFLAYALALSGHKSEARETLQDLQTLSRSEYLSSFNLITVHVGLGNYEAAFPLLEKALEERDYVVRFKTEPVLDPLRADPRFQSLLRRAGLPNS